MSSLDRRAFLRLSTAAGAAVVLSGPATVARAVAPGLRVYVLVVDGLRPDEVTPSLMPRLSELKSRGTAYPAARSLPVAETLPNHVMMASGMRPDRTGVPANSVYDRETGEVRTLDQPNDLAAPTVLERLATAGHPTGTVLSKTYLYGIFGTRATYRWEPQPIVPVSEHAPDPATVDALIAMVDAHDPHMVFANLGDVDRMGHADLSGTTLAAARTAALSSTDTQVGRFVDHLGAAGLWGQSVLLVLADHSMDWSLPHRTVSLAPAFDRDPMLAGRYALAQNGGAELAYWTGPDAERPAAVTRMRELAESTAGVLAAHDPADLRLGPQAGDLVAYCRAGWRFTDPKQHSNPIPGNHGHPATEPIPFLVTGGHDAIVRGAASSAPARTVDVAPTVGALFELPAPVDGYDGTARTEGFSAVPA